MRHHASPLSHRIRRRTAPYGAVPDPRCARGSVRRKVDAWREVLLELGGRASVDALEQFAEVVLDGGHGGDDGRRAEAVSDEREVTEMTLDSRVERHGGRRQGAGRGGGKQRPGTEWRLITDQ